MKRRGFRVPLPAFPNFSYNSAFLPIQLPLPCRSGSGRSQPRGYSPAFPPAQMSACRGAPGLPSATSCSRPDAFLFLGGTRPADCTPTPLLPDPPAPALCHRTRSPAITLAARNGACVAVCKGSFLSAPSHPFPCLHSSKDLGENNSIQLVTLHVFKMEM